MSIYPERPEPHLARCIPELPFEDHRGVIQPLVDAPMGGCALINSKAGSVRANHYHREDWHYVYVVSGEIEYHHREVGSAEPPVVERFGAGAMFHSPPMVEHAMYFPVDTSFVVLSHLSRPKEAYEEDVVRVADLTGKLETTK